MNLATAGPFRFAGERRWPPRTLTVRGGHRLLSCGSIRGRSPDRHFVTVTVSNVSAVRGLGTSPSTLPLTTRAGGEWLIGIPGTYSSAICWLIFL